MENNPIKLSIVPLLFSIVFALTALEVDVAIAADDFQDKNIIMDSYEDGKRSDMRQWIWEIGCRGSNKQCYLNEVHAVRWASGNDPVTIIDINAYRGIITSIENKKYIIEFKSSDGTNTQCAPLRVTVQLADKARSIKSVQGVGGCIEGRIMKQSEEKFIELRHIRNSM